MNITYTKYCYVNVRFCVKQYKQHKEKKHPRIYHVTNKHKLKGLV